jgi:hypothetical protein
MEATATPLIYGAPSLVLSRDTHVRASTRQKLSSASQGINRICLSDIRIESGRIKHRVFWFRNASKLQIGSIAKKSETHQI